MTDIDEMNDYWDGDFDDDERVCDVCDSNEYEGVGFAFCKSCGGMFAPGSEECDFCDYCDECEEIYMKRFSK